MISEDRFPTHVRLASWRAMSILHRHYPSGFQLAAISELTEPAYRKALFSWALWLCAEDVLRGHGNGFYSLQVVGDCPPPGRPLAGRFGRAQSHLWTAMRALRRFTLSELIEAATTDDQPIGRDSAQAYVAALCANDVLSAMAHGWRLKPGADTGPRAPVLVHRSSSTPGLFDLNLGRPVNVTGLRRAS